MRASAKILGVMLLFALALGAAIWYAAIREDRGGKLTVSYLDVGKGEAIFVDAPSGRQLLIDGGPDDSILRDLGEAMPLYDRSIDVVVAADPSAADAGGLSGVLSRYDISYIVRTNASMPSLDSSIADAEARGTRVLIGVRGQVIDLGQGAYLEILSPDQSAGESDACLALRLVYGRTAFLFPCGNSQTFDEYLAILGGSSLKSDVVLADASSSPLLLGFADPEWAVLSGGCADDLSSSSVFAQLGIQALDTCGGSAVFISDGQTVQRE